MDILLSEPFQFLLFIVALVITLTVHEAAHALVAYYLGDPTAKMKGRLTLNPIAHLDPVGSILFLVTQRIGWGKPVPVNPGNFKNPVRDSALTALAGPASNFLFAFALTLPLKYLDGLMPAVVSGFLWTMFHVNIYLGIFNLFPFPPLDGSKILGLLVPRRYHRQYEKFLREGLIFFIVIIVFDVFILSEFVGFSFFGYLIGKLHDWAAIVLLLGT